MTPFLKYGSPFCCAVPGATETDRHHDGGIDCYGGRAHRFPLRLINATLDYLKSGNKLKRQKEPRQRAPASLTILDAGKKLRNVLV